MGRGGKTPSLIFIKSHYYSLLTNRLINEKVLSLCSIASQGYESLYTSQTYCLILRFNSLRFVIREFTLHSIFVQVYSCLSFPSDIAEQGIEPTRSILEYVCNRSTPHLKCIPIPPPCFIHLLSSFLYTSIL